MSKKDNNKIIYGREMPIDLSADTITACNKSGMSAAEECAFDIGSPDTAAEILKEKTTDVRPDEGDDRFSQMIPYTNSENGAGSITVSIAG